MAKEPEWSIGGVKLHDWQVKFILTESPAWFSTLRTSGRLRKNGKTLAQRLASPESVSVFLQDETNG